MSLICYKNYVDGTYIDNASGETFDVINPATGKVIYQVEVADAQVQEKAIASAKLGFETWSAMSATERSRILRYYMNVMKN